MVGHGLAGLVTAAELLAAGRHVTLLDAEGPLAGGHLPGRLPVHRAARRRRGGHRRLSPSRPAPMGWAPVTPPRPRRRRSGPRAPAPGHPAGRTSARAAPHRG
ncbi:hypothetical protein [Kytococcus sedentarius]|uniref:hypothetical protein n=1 Tax=Kytococcus sedentarius TaxID=1276 RepID=UPI00384BDB39